MQFGVENYATAEFEPVFNFERIAGIVGGESQQCDDLVDMVLRVKAIDPFIEKMLETIIVQDPQFKVSADPAQKLESNSLAKADPRLGHIIYVNPNDSDAEQLFVHELTHYFLSVVMQEFYGQRSEQLLEPDITKIFSSQKAHAGFKNYKKQGDDKIKQALKNIASRTKGEKLTKLYKALDDSGGEYKTTFPMRTKKVHDYKWRYAVGAEFLVSQLKIGLDDVELKVKIVAVEDQGDGQLNLILKPDDKLAAILLTYFYNQQQVLIKGYSAARYDEEFITHLFQFLPVPLIKELYPDIIMHLNRYVDQLAQKNSPVDKMELPRDAAYIFNHEAKLMEARNIGVDKIDTASALALIFKIVDRNDHASIDLGITMANAQLKKVHTKTGMDAEAATIELVNIHLAELYYLKGDMHKAVKLYARVYQFVSKFSDENSYFWTLPGWGHLPLTHYAEAARQTHQPFPKKLQEKLATFSQQRFYP